MAYALFLDDGCDQEPSLLVVSRFLSKIESLKKELGDKYTATHKIYTEYHLARSEKFLEFQKINKEFWLRNKLAIKNPSHQHGLWIIREFKPGFCPPSGLGDYFFPDSSYQEVRPMSEQEIELTRNGYVQLLSQMTDYSKLLYIDWDKIQEPIPLFYMEEYGIEPPIIEGYHPDYLIIKEIEEI